MVNNLNDDLARAPVSPPRSPPPAHRYPRSALAMVYPTLLAAVGNVARPAWRARAVGVCRLWRDSFAVGALLAGLLADAYGIRPASSAVAALTAVSGLLVWVRMYETHPAGRH
jgi:hypothetical protein